MRTHKIGKVKLTENLDREGSINRYFLKVAGKNPDAVIYEVNAYTGYVLMDGCIWTLYIDRYGAQKWMCLALTTSENINQILEAYQAIKAEIEG